MVMGSKFGQMVHGMKGTGNITKPVEKESFGMWMEMCSKGSGKMTRRMDMESTFT